MTPTQNLQTVFDKIEEIAKYFISKVEKDDKLNLNEIEIGRDYFYFSVDAKNGFNFSRYDFPLNSLDLKPIEVYNIWNKARLERRKKEKEEDKQIKLLAKHPEVKKYIKLTELPF